MLHALIQGELIADPQERQTATGKLFVTATVRVSTTEDTTLVGVAAFGEAAGKLASLRKGDALAATGTLTPRTWTGRDGVERKGLNLTAQAVMTVYEAGKRRRALQGAGDDGRSPAGSRPRVGVEMGEGWRRMHAPDGDGFPDDPL